MGFWDSVGNLAKGAATQLETFNIEVKQLAEEYASEDDDFLKRKFKSGNAAQKAAAAKVLKSRGYGSQS